MINARTALRFKDALPAATDVVVIGGGVIGVFAALYLRRMGKSVVLCEKGRVAGEQSSRNWGWIRQQGRDPAELPLAIEARHLWKAVDKELGGGAGYTQGGVHYLASTEQEIENLTPWLEIAKQHGLGSMMLSAAQVSSLIRQETLGARTWIGGLYTPTDGRAEPWQAVPAVSELAHAEGVVFREGCAVRCLDVAGGRLAGVVTECGRVGAEQVVLAGGAWSSLLLRRHGMSIPQLMVRGTVCATEPLPEVLAGCAIDEEFALRRRTDGGYTLAGHHTHHMVGPDSFRHALSYAPLLKSFPDIGFRLAGFHNPDAWGTRRQWGGDEVTPFETTRVLDPPPDDATVQRLRGSFAARFPELGAPAIKGAWGGMIDTMPDIVPIVDRMPQLPGLTVATGMSAHGFGIGPAYGKAIAHIVAGTDVGHDMRRFRAGRFADGSQLDPGPSL